MPLLFGFKWSGDVESSSQAVANVSIEVIDDGDLPYPAGTECLRKINWSIKPVNLTGTGGQSTDLHIKDRQYKSSVQTGGCFYNQSVQDLKEGEWKIEATGSDSVYASWKTDCSVSLRPGENTVYFKMGMPGCSTSAYPY
jgi:hypothetical protein